MYCKHPTPRVATRHLTHAFTETLETRTLFAVTTNDPQLASQWALTNTGVKDAWSTTVGKASTTVADIDSGADYTHQDLYKNIWINQAEIPTSVKSKLVDTDTDGRITFYDLNATANTSVVRDLNANGRIDGGDLLKPLSSGGWADGINGKSNTADVYTDDIIGWDFAENDNNPYDDGSANFGHGTHTAGIIGAVGNNGVGISGVAQKVGMMIVRIFADSGYSTSLSRLASAIRYTADNGAKAANASWGGNFGSGNSTIYNAIAYAGSKGMAFVTAAGNSGWNLDSPYYTNYPAEFSLSNIIVVGSDTSSGNLSYFSNYGATTVDVVAPGSSILSTLPGNRYGTMSGTSMATPMVTGAVALMVSANPALTVAQIKQRLIDGSDESSALNNRSVSDGELNVKNAVLGVSGVNLASVSTTSTSTTQAGIASSIFGFTGRASARSIFNTTTAIA
jgi:subtilisin family serine protease